MHGIPKLSVKDEVVQDHFKYIKYASEGSTAEGLVKDGPRRLFW